MQTPDAFRAAHGDPTTWSAADFDGYEHTLKAASPVFADAIAAGRVVFGRHAEGDQVVADLVSAEDLAQHRDAGALRPLVVGTGRSGTDLAVLFAPAAG
ncbi:hypothetical protein ABT104_06120 [Streptomyces mobaraensis]|uniref:hypothetical protein n=1 Tax=Streptomyces mobaraensis TaxID=35621 RepID=UPI00331EEE4F